ncbi:LysE family translocator [uncultured Corynebacterium sp.]|uniref:LysE family translocator n=1 Tax=uncultured Corynebacterium sp. TaxID=159447 RepID=UPI003390721F
MISLGDLAVIVGLNLVGAAAPGPDLILIMRMATRSRQHAWAATAGVQTGVLLWVTLTVAGAAAVLTAYPAALAFVQIVGGAFLVWMGQASVRQGWHDRNVPPVDIGQAAERLGSLRSSYLKGLTTNLANPKIVIALSAMIAPLLPAHPSPLTAGVVILALWLSSFVLFGILSQVLSTGRVRRRLLAAGPLIDIASGLFFLAVGIVFLVRGAQGLG